MSLRRWEPKLKFVDKEIVLLLSSTGCELQHGVWVYHRPQPDVRAKRFEDLKFKFLPPSQLTYIHGKFSNNVTSNSDVFFSDYNIPSRSAWLKKIYRLVLLFFTFLLLYFKLHSIWRCKKTIVRNNWPVFKTLEASIEA